MGKASSPSNSNSLQRLREEMALRLNRDEFEVLCHDLNASSVVKPGSLENELLQLLSYLNHTDRLNDLIDKLNERLPQVEWNSLITVSSSAVPEKPSMSQSHSFVVRDAFSRHESGMAKLSKVIPIDHQRRGDFDTQQMRLAENINKARRFGDPPSRQAERAEIFDAINAISREVTGRSFNDWMDD